MSIRIAILDDDKAYADSLMAFCSERYSGEITPGSFSSVATLAGYMAKSKVNLILASPAMLPDPGVFTDGTPVAYLVKEKGAAMYGSYPAIFRYQRGSLIINRIKGIVAESGDNGIVLGADGGGKVLTFFGVHGGAGCTTAALGCAGQIAAAGKKVIYLNLQSNATVAHCLHGEGDGNLARVLYDVKSYLSSSDKKANLTVQLESRLKYESRLRFQYFDALQMPLEMTGVKPEEVELILTTLSKSCDYVIVDTDGVMGDLLLAELKLSTQIILVCDGHPGSNIRLEQMESAIRVLDEDGRVRVMERVRVLYSRFGSRSRYSDRVSFQVLGSISNYSGADMQSIVQDISGGTQFRGLM